MHWQVCLDLIEWRILWLTREGRNIGQYRTMKLEMVIVILEL